MKKIIKYFYLIIISLFISGCLTLPTVIENILPAENILPPTISEIQKNANKPKYVRGIHLTAWVAGSARRRKLIAELLTQTELNTVVIAVKEYHGEVYVPGEKRSEELKTYVPAIPDLENYLQVLKSSSVYTVARIVVFKDNIVARRKPEWAVKDPQGNIWQDYRGNSWLDPYCREVWDYNLSIAERCAELGFDEIQFDYIRFPSDGNIRNCRYSQVHSSSTAVGTVIDFLAAAKNRLSRKQAVNISADVFGLTTSAEDDLGIGQVLTEMAKQVDFICPMVYPSHYAKGEYGIPDPNLQPYRTVSYSLAQAVKILGADSTKLRPYYQDFSLGCRYGTNEVLMQIQAGYDNAVPEWTLWSPNVTYHRQAFKTKNFSDTYQKSDPDKIIELFNNRVLVSTPKAVLPPPTAMSLPLKKEETKASSTIEKAKEYLQNLYKTFWK